MTWRTLTSEARNARVLAQRLYGQCRKSASIWKTLTPALRKIRNSLEELEDLIDGGQLKNIKPTHIFESLHACTAALRDLDRHLQFYRCSAARWQAAISRTIAEVDAALGAAADSLVSLLDAETRDPNQEQLDTPQYCASSPTKNDDEMVNAAKDPRHVTAVVNSAQPHELVNEAASIPLPLSPVVEPVDGGSTSPESTSDSNELPQDTHGQLLLPTASLRSQRNSLLEWRMPFAEVDPLSIDFESATTILLASPQDEEDLRPTDCKSGDLDTTENAWPESAQVSGTPHPPSSTSDVNNAASTERLHGSSSIHLVDSNPKDSTSSCDSFDATMDRSVAADEIGEERNCQSTAQTACLAAPSAAVAKQQIRNSDEDNYGYNDAADATYVGWLSAWSAADPQSTTQSEASLSDNDSAIMLTSLMPPVVLDNKQHDDETVKPSAEDMSTEPFSKSLSACQEAKASDASSRLSLQPPRSKYAAHDALCMAEEASQPIRNDSKVDIRIAALPASTATLVEADKVQPTVKHLVEDMPLKGLSADPDIFSLLSRSVSPISPLDIGLGSPQGYSSSGQQVPSPLTTSADESTAVAKHMPPSYQPPRGRYRIVNGAPESETDGLSTATSRHQSRPVSPVSSTASGEIPVVLADECQEQERSTMQKPVDDMSRASENRLAPPTKFDDEVSTFSADFLYAQKATSTEFALPLAAQDGPIREYYSGLDNDESSEIFDVDMIRIQSLCMSWHRQDWHLAETYLQGLIEAQQGQVNKPLQRRIRHLIGVCASFQGQWQRAIPYFISVLNTPLSLVSPLDDGDCAALVWLADCYVLTNRRLDAFIANALVVGSFERHRNGQASLSQTLQLEQKALLTRTSIPFLEHKWLQQQIPRNDSVLNPHVVALGLVELCFRQSYTTILALPHSNAPVMHNRASVLQLFECSDTDWAEAVEFQVSPESFVVENSWPLPFDPFFNTKQAARGRFCDDTSDILLSFQSSPALKLPKNGPLSTSRFDCFTCGDLEWLVTAVRDCLVFLEMRWDEVVNTNGVWFMARFAVKYRNVLTANYFAISLFRQSMRQSYGVEVCVDNVRSARVMSDAVDYPMGVHYSCEKRLKKFFKDYLTRAHRLWVKNGRPAPASTGASIDA